MQKPPLFGVGANIIINLTFTVTIKDFAFLAKGKGYGCEARWAV
jgi:hypothetical protein